MVQGSELTWHATAAANILAARKKNGRPGGNRSRGGCAACKLRKTKCDKDKPRCGRCVNSGRDCEYLETTPPSRSNNSLIGVQLSQTLGLRDSDRRTFDYFLSWTAPHLAGHLDREFWCGQVLQLARREPPVMDALLAISVLYEHPQWMRSFRAETPSSAESSVSGHCEGETPGSDTQPHELLETGKRHSSGLILPQSMSPIETDEHHTLALRYYNRAIGGLVVRLKENDEDPLLALLSCALFICIEIMRDNVFTALELFNQGTELLRQYNDSFVVGNRNLNTTLRLIFDRLGVVASLYGHGHAHSVHAGKHYKKIDHRQGFASMVEARTALFSLMAEGQAFIQRAKAEMTGLGPHTIQKSQYNANDPKGNAWRGMNEAPVDPGVTRLYYGVDNAWEVDTAFPRTEFASFSTKEPSPELLNEQARLEMRLKQWHTAFTQVSRNGATTELLLMYYHGSCIWLTTRLSLYQTVFDQHVDRFAEILRLAEIYIKSTPGTTFAFEIGVIVPLYLVATKCRISSYRHRAIDLIRKAPGKESTWGSKSVAEFADRLISIEEADLWLKHGIPKTSCSSSYLPNSVLPPESSRIHSFEILKNWTAGGHDVRVTRYSSGPGGIRTKHVDDYPI